jgi:hypothetical protein
MANQQPLSPLGPDVPVTHILLVTDPARSRDFWVNRAIAYTGASRKQRRTGP